MQILSQEEVMKHGIEFIGEVCYSGQYGQQVYTCEIEDGGLPLEGILYERYSNGLLNYYSFYKNGIPNGERVYFYETGNIKSYCVMDNGTIDGEHVEWFENGSVKMKEFCKYGFVLKMQEFNENGSLVNEKTDLREDEKSIYKKRVAYYEGGK